MMGIRRLTAGLRKTLCIWWQVSPCFEETNENTTAKLGRSEVEGQVDSCHRRLLGPRKTADNSSQTLLVPDLVPEKGSWHPQGNEMKSRLAPSSMQGWNIRARVQKAFSQVFLSGVELSEIIVGFLLSRKTPISSASPACKPLAHVHMASNLTIRNTL